jgi:predicted negative regulator of RcsB-dependent stress response
VGALAYYEQVLALPDVPREAQIAAAEGRADVLVLQGDDVAARVAYTQAIELGSTSAFDKQAMLTTS